MTLSLILILLLKVEAGMQEVNFASQILIPGIVKGKPFQAEFEQVIIKKLSSGQNREVSMKGMIFRDSEGRRRKEMRLQKGTGLEIRLAHIFDPVTKVTCILDITHKTATKAGFSTTQEASDNLWESLSQSLSKSKTPAPIKKLEGLSCHVFNIKEGETNLEFCLSEELSEVLYENTVSETEEKAVRVFSIHRTEPDGALFTIPIDYKIINR